MPASKTKGPLSSPLQELESTILKVLAREPTRQDLRLKLLGLYYSSGNSQDFLQAARDFREYGGDELDSKEWQTVAKMGRTLEIDSPLFRRDSGKSDGPDFGGGTASKRFGQDPAAQSALSQLLKDYEGVRRDAGFLAEFDLEQARLGRPTPLYVPRRFNSEGTGASICLKREDHSPSGSRLSLHVLGQALLAKKLGRSTLLASSSDGRKGVIVASIGARLGLKVRVFMDGGQMRREDANIKRMQMMGAKVDPVDVAKLPRSDIRESALQLYVKRPRDHFMVMGLDAGPEPYAMLASELCSVIGREVRRQVQAQFKRAPSLLVARGGESADALGFFDPFIDERDIRLVCVEPAGTDPVQPDDEDSYDQMQIDIAEQQAVHMRAILEGLEYPSVAREHQRLKATGRVEYRLGYTKAGQEVLQDLARTEGLLISLETAQALAWAREAAKTMPTDEVVVVMVSQRADLITLNTATASG